MMTNTQMANEVRDKVEALNVVLKLAHEWGLDVDLAFDVDGIGLTIWDIYAIEKL